LHASLCPNNALHDPHEFAELLAEGEVEVNSTDFGDKAGQLPAFEVLDEDGAILIEHEGDGTVTLLNDHHILEDVQSDLAQVPKPLLAIDEDDIDLLSDQFFQPTHLFLLLLLSNQQVVLLIEIGEYFEPLFEPILIFVGVGQALDVLGNQHRNLVRPEYNLLSVFLKDDSATGQLLILQTALKLAIAELLYYCEPLDVCLQVGGVDFKT
jgi:hypothetical protein